MEVTLPADLTIELQQKVAAGPYESADALIGQAVRRFFEAEHRGQIRLDALRRIGRAADRAGSSTTVGCSPSPLSGSVGLLNGGFSAGSPGRMRPCQLCAAEPPRLFEPKWSEEINTRPPHRDWHLSIGTGEIVCRFVNRSLLSARWATISATTARVVVYVFVAATDFSSPA